MCVLRSNSIAVFILVVQSCSCTRLLSVVVRFLIISLQCFKVFSKVCVCSSNCFDSFNFFEHFLIILIFVYFFEFISSCVCFVSVLLYVRRIRFSYVLDSYGTLRSNRSTDHRCTVDRLCDPCPVVSSTIRTTKRP